MPEKIVRKPVGNFFIKKSLQMGLIIKVMTASLISAALTGVTLLVYYLIKYETMALYIWDQDSNNLEKTDNIVYLILPTLLISSLVSVIVAFGIGLYASRKYAVPVFKIEQWASMLLNGQMTAVLRFREQEEMKDLSQKCNELGAKFRETMIDIKKCVKTMQDAGVKHEELNGIARSLENMELMSGPIEIKSPHCK